MALGFIGGYPVGARTALQLYQQGHVHQNGGGAAAVLLQQLRPGLHSGRGGGGGVRLSGRVGLLLYLTHAAASLLVGLLFRFYKAGGTPRRTPPPVRATFETVRASAAFTGAVAEALQSTLSICAFVVFFSVALRLLSAYGVLTALARLLALFGRWAPSGPSGWWPGCWSCPPASPPSPARERRALSMAAFMLGWAGISVHCQVLSFLGDSGLSPRTYLAGKLCHGLIAAALTATVTRLFPLSEPVSSYLADQADAIAGLDFSSALAISLATVFALWAGWVLLCARMVKKSSGKTPRHRL